MTAARERQPHLDQVLGPTDDTVKFFQPRAMVFVTMLWVIAAVWATALALHLLVRVATGYVPSGGTIVIYVEIALIVPVVMASVILLVAWRRLGWLYCSIRGLDFAATGRRPVHLPWAGVAAVSLRGWGPFTELVITPVSEDFAAIGTTPGRRPRMRRRGGQVAYLVDVGLMSPGPEVLLAELHCRLPDKT
ncbi:BPS1 family protein [Actinoplanes sp. KI2]|uniref:BPS1 family protein n=1 Tax=Actinoplanes sp. KI2 TaxID=2983315 RepID=UPI0021D5F2B5|nr:BPS1 family protein [Actinoplanes sp. KI2]MCU7726556.1 BPS1 family protein [Actinoplanes sp. KI2]